MTKFVVLRANTYSYRIDDGSEYEKAKGAENFVIKRKFKFENYKNFLEATQVENTMNYFGKNEINLESLKKDHKQCIRN